MSAEKEIVNYWYNKRGLFTISNLKTAGNKDAGILALKFDKNNAEYILHVQIICSITNNITETTNLAKSVGNLVGEKFDDKNIEAAINSKIRQFSVEKSKIKKIVVLGAVPRSRKLEIIREFNEKGVEVIEFEDIIYDVMEQLDTQYYKNDVIRTLQLTKFLLLSEPSKMAKMLANDDFTSNSRKEFLASILSNDDIVKDFRKTNAERLSAILKSSGLKPAELAGMLEHDILNKKTRKMFLNSLMEQENIRKLIKPKKTRKLETPLERFF